MEQNKSPRSKQRKSAETERPKSAEERRRAVEKEVDRTLSESERRKSAETGRRNSTEKEQTKWTLDEQSKSAQTEQHRLSQTEKRRVEERRKSSMEERRRSTQMKYISPIQQTDWPFKLGIELKLSGKPKIAFMSGHDREYFPDQSGHSRFGIAYSMARAPGDVPNPSYFPSEDKLQKPVSRKGYGIGGLSGPRFYRLHWTETPDPGAYQSFTRLQEQKKELKQIIRRSTINKAMAYAAVKAVALGNVGNTHKKSTVRPTTANGGEHVCIPKEALRERPKTVAFGSLIKTPRFQKDPKWSTTGPGHYDTWEPKTCRKIKMQSNFGKPQMKISTVTKCDYDKRDFCGNCDTELTPMDYYLSKIPVILPQLQKASTEERKSNHRHIHNIGSVPSRNDPSKTTLGSFERDKHQQVRSRHVALCHRCFCQLKKDSGHSFNKERFISQFMKTRHCDNVHAHYDLPAFTMKAPCPLVKRLTVLESRMAKHFPDNCPNASRERTLTN